jgi:hypothetical protein
MLATRAAVMARAIVPIPRVIPGQSPLFQRIWPIAVLALGSATSVAWTALWDMGSLRSFDWRFRCRHGQLLSFGLVRRDGRRHWQSLTTSHYRSKNQN